jgi:hypothetical protein
MKPPALVGAAIAGLLLANVAVETPCHAQSRRGRARSESARSESARACVTFSRAQSADGRTLTMTVDNRCTFEVESTISWRLVCGDSDLGTPVERTERLTAGQRRVIVASVDACGAGSFSIEGVRWTWRNPGS